MLCLNCGETRPETTVKCPVCQIDISPMSDHKSHVSQLIRIAESVINGDEGVEVLESMVSQLFQLFDGLEEKQNELKKHVPQECEEFFEQYQEATLLLFDALDEMDIYFEDSDSFHINEGIKMIKKAEKLHYDSLANFDDIN
jgi:NAD-specific glutamate dehydrogenase